MGWPSFLEDLEKVREELSRLQGEQSKTPSELQFEAHTKRLVKLRDHLAESVASLASNLADLEQQSYGDFEGKEGLLIANTILSEKVRNQEKKILEGEDKLRRVNFELKQRSRFESHLRESTQEINLKFQELASAVPEFKIHPRSRVESVAAAIKEWAKAFKLRPIAEIDKLEMEIENLRQKWHRDRQCLELSKKKLSRKVSDQEKIIQRLIGMLNEKNKK